MSVAQFCRDDGLHLGNFHAWRLRIAELDAKTCDSSAEVRQENGGGPSTKSTFVQLAIPANSSTFHQDTWIEVSLANGMVVRVSSSNLAAIETVIESLNRLGAEGHL